MEKRRKTRFWEWPEVTEAEFTKFLDSFGDELQKAGRTNEGFMEEEYFLGEELVARKVYYMTMNPHYRYEKERNHKWFYYTRPEITIGEEQK